MDKKDSTYRFRVGVRDGIEYTSAPTVLTPEQCQEIVDIIANIKQLSHFKMPILNKHGGTDTIFINSTHIISITIIEQESV